jgi:hypothetical protein
MLRLLTTYAFPPTSSFLGSGTFCFKACDASEPNTLELCQHTYDRVGCAYNAPATYDQINGTFTSCQGDLQDPVGIYVTNGVTMTYQQPPESLGPIQTIPYTARVPSSSNCQTFQSADLFTAVSVAFYILSSLGSVTNPIAIRLRPLPHLPLPSPRKPRDSIAPPSKEAPLLSPRKRARLPVPTEGSSPSVVFSVVSRFSLLLPSYKRIIII